jgi:hypothetical protein
LYVLSANDRDHSLCHACPYPELAGKPEAHRPASGRENSSGLGVLASVAGLVRCIQPAEKLELLPAGTERVADPFDAAQRSTLVWWALSWQRMQRSGLDMTLTPCGPLWQSTHEGTVP